MPRGTARQCIELAEAGSEMVRVTVNVPEAAAAVPEIKRRMLDAGVTAPLIGDFHYNGHLLLTRFPDCAAGARQVPHQSRQRRHRQAPRRAVRDDLRRRARPQQAGPHRRERRLAQPGAGRREDAGEHRPRRSAAARKRSSTSAWSSRPCSRPSSRSSPGSARDQIIISCKTSRPRDLIAVYRELSRKTDQPLHLGLTEAGMGTKGLVWSRVGDGDSAERRHRRHDPRVADAAAGRRSPRRSLRRVRAAAGAGAAVVLARA